MKKGLIFMIVFIVILLTVIAIMYVKNRKFLAKRTQAKQQTITKNQSSAGQNQTQAESVSAG